jgi:hypothetical protein
MGWCRCSCYWPIYWCNWKIWQRIKTCMSTYDVPYVTLRGIVGTTSLSFQTMWWQVHRVHFHMGRNICVKYEANGPSMCHHSAKPCISMRLWLTHSFFV